jgi:hypothetical protein
MESRFRKVKLTQSAVDKAEPEASRYVLSDTAIRGFWLRCGTDRREKSFKLRYRVGGGRKGTVREPKIGDAKAMKLLKAREIAEEWLAELRRAATRAASGKPTATRRPWRISSSAYLADHARPNKKATSLAEDERLIAIICCPALGKRRWPKSRGRTLSSFTAAFEQALSREPLPRAAVQGVQPR